MKQKPFTLSRYAAFLRRCIVPAIVCALCLAACVEEETVEQSARRYAGSVSFTASVDTTLVVTRAAQPIRHIEFSGGTSPMYARVISEPGIALRQDSGSVSCDGVAATTRGAMRTSTSFHPSMGLYIYEHAATETWAEKKSTLAPRNSNLRVLESTGWLYITSEFWPGDTKRLSFVAYAPHTDDADGLTASITAGTRQLSYTVPADATKQPDLLVCQSKPDVAGNFPDIDTKADKGVVHLPFTHVCTAVRFAIGSTMAPCTIKKIEMTGIRNKGTYDIEGDAWTLDNTSTADFTMSPGYEVTTQRNVVFTTGDNVFMMLPQTVPAGAILKVTVNDGGDDVTIEASLAGEVWPQNTTVTYYLTTTRENSNYILSVEQPADVAYSGGSTELKISSYRQTYFGTRTKEPWTLEYSEDGGTTWKTANEDIVTAMSAYSNSETGTYTTSYTVTATLAKSPVSKKTSSGQSTLASATAKGTAEHYFNLAHQSTDQSGATGATENTANCYVVQAPGYYSIPLAYGNAIKSSDTNDAAIGSEVKFNHYVDHKGEKVTKPYIYDSYMDEIGDAVIVWQDSPLLITPSSLKLSDDKKCIEFQIEKENINEGNAVIAVRDASETIMWSWHIWVTHKTLTDYIPVEGYSGGGRASAVETDKNQFMPVPLGFCTDETKHYIERMVKVRVTQTNSAIDPAEFTITQTDGTEKETVSALSYQWGRKDPTQPAYYSFATSSGGFKELYNNTYDCTAITTGTVDIKTAIQHPYIFYNHNPSYYTVNTCWLTNSGSYKDLWCVGNTSTGYTNNPVEKSIYDPCPVGFKMMQANAMSIFQIDDTQHGQNGDQRILNKASYDASDNSITFYTKIDKTTSAKFYVFGEKRGSSPNVGWADYSSAFPNNDAQQSSGPRILWKSEFSEPRGIYKGTIGKGEGCTVYPVKDTD